MSEALVRVEAGRVDEVAAAYDDHQRDLHAFALAIMRDREEADDVVGETFLRFVREVREGRAPEAHPGLVVHGVHERGPGPPPTAQRGRPVAPHAGRP